MPTPQSWSVWSARRASDAAPTPRGRSPRPRWPSGSESFHQHAASGGRAVRRADEHATAREIGAALLRSAEVGVTGERIEIRLDRRDAHRDVCAHALGPASVRVGDLGHGRPLPHRSYRSAVRAQLECGKPFCAPHSQAHAAIRRPRSANRCARSGEAGMRDRSASTDRGAGASSRSGSASVISRHRCARSRAVRARSCSSASTGTAARCPGIATSCCAPTCAFSLADVMQLVHASGKSGFLMFEHADCVEVRVSARGRGGVRELEPDDRPARANALRAGVISQQD